MAQHTDRAPSFAANEAGGVTITFAIMLTVLVLAAGVALDYARMLNAQFAVSAAADAAALAAGRTLSLGDRSQGEIEQAAQIYFRENLASRGDFGEVGDLTVAIDRDAGKVKVDGSVRVPMTLTRVAGFDTVDIPVMAETTVGQQEVELAMVLDVTGSMNTPSSKIADLRRAANDLVEQLLGDANRSGKIRVALVPYAASVNAGSYFTAATGRASGTGCVIERAGAARFAEDAPGSGTYLGYDRNAPCPSVSVQPLTSDKRSLLRQIGGLRASGQTAGHIGTAWGWYMLSPEWKSFWPTDSRPKDYKPAKVVKAVLLMTDGEFNTEYVAANGSSAAQARALCENMKDEDVIVYSVGFMANNTAERLLKQCATSAGHYFPASNGKALQEAFAAIGQNLTNLHLSQ